MPDLFTTEQLRVYLRLSVDEFDADAAALAHSIVSSWIRPVVGAARYDALTDLSSLLGVALPAAARVYDNPTQVASESIDDHRVSYRGGAGLTEREKTDIRASLGRSSAFSVRPAAPSMCPVPVYRTCEHPYPCSCPA